MEIFEQISVVIKGPAVTLILGWVWWRLCHTIDIGPGGLEQHLTWIDEQTDQSGQANIDVTDSIFELLGGLDC